MIGLSGGGVSVEANSRPRRKASSIAEGCFFTWPGSSILLTKRLVAKKFFLVIFLLTFV